MTSYLAVIPSPTTAVRKKMDLCTVIDRRAKANATARRRLGARVRTLDQLHRLACEKRSVFSPYWGLLPATAVLNMQARGVYQAISSKRLFVYKPRTLLK